jgi:hypothetical protein
MLNKDRNTILPNAPKVDHTVPQIAHSSWLSMYGGEAAAAATTSSATSEVSNEAQHSATQLLPSLDSPTTPHHQPDSVATSDVRPDTQRKGERKAVNAQSSDDSDSGWQGCGGGGGGGGGKAPADTVVRVYMFACLVQEAIVGRELSIRIMLNKQNSFDTPMGIASHAQGAGKLTVVSAVIDFPKEWVRKQNYLNVQYVYRFESENEVFNEGQVRCFDLQKLDTQKTVCDDEILDPNRFGYLRGGPKLPRRNESMEALVTHFIRDLHSLRASVATTMNRMSSLRKMGMVKLNHARDVSFRAGFTGSFFDGLTTGYIPGLADLRECTDYRNFELQKALQRTSSSPQLQLVVVVTRCIFAPQEKKRLLSRGSWILHISENKLGKCELHRGTGNYKIEYKDGTKCACVEADDLFLMFKEYEAQVHLRACADVLLMARGNFKVSDAGGIEGRNFFVRALRTMVKLSTLGRHSSLEWLLAIPLLHLAQGDCMTSGMGALASVRGYLADVPPTRDVTMAADSQNWPLIISRVEQLLSIDSKFAPLVLAIGPVDKVFSNSKIRANIPFSTVCRTLYLQFEKPAEVPPSAAAAFLDALATISRLPVDEGGSDESGECGRVCLAALRRLGPQLENVSEKCVELLSLCIQLLGRMSSASADDVMAGINVFLVRKFVSPLKPDRGTELQAELRVWDKMVLRSQQAPPRLREGLCLMLTQGFSDRLGDIGDVKYLSMYSEADNQVSSAPLRDVVFARANDALEKLLLSSQGTESSYLRAVRKDSRLLATMLIFSWPGIRNRLAKFQKSRFQGER